jgi:hypothetical protein
MISTSMTGKKTRPFSIKQNISSLNQQIKTKEKLAQKIIDQKRDLRQSYIEAMAEIRKNTSNELASIESTQNNFTSAMDRLDNEEEVFSLEIKELSERRAQLNKSLIDQNANLFIPNKITLTLIIIALIALSAGLLLSQEHSPFNRPSPEKEMQD